MIGGKIKAHQVATSVPFDNAGISFDATDVQAALQELHQHRVFDPEYTTTSVGGTLTLTGSSTSLHILSGTATGYTVKMPDATTLFLGEEYFIGNTGSQPMTIRDGNNGVLFTLSQNSIGFLVLQAKGSAAGTWIFWQNSIGIANGIISYNVVSSTNFSTSINGDTLITGMTVTPQAGTYAIWFGSQNSSSGSGQQLDCTIYKGGSAITDSKRSVLSTSGTHIFQISSQTIAQFDGSQACDVRVDANGNSMTIAARSLLLIRLGP